MTALLSTQPPVHAPRKYLTLEEACLYLGCKKSKLYALSGEEVPYFKKGNKRWYLPEDLDEYIASGRCEIYRQTRRRQRRSA